MQKSSKIILLRTIVNREKSSSSFFYFFLPLFSVKKNIPAITTNMSIRIVNVVKSAVSFIPFPFLFLSGTYCNKKAISIRFNSVIIVNPTL